MIAWYFVWVELLMWTSLISFLILPAPLTMKYFFVKGLNAIAKSFYFRAFFVANVCIILFQFGDSYNQMLKYQANKDALGAGMTTGAGSLGEKIDVNMKLFRAQRNVYLSFFCGFEIFIFYGFAKLISQLADERSPTKTSTKVDQKMDKLENKIEKKNDEIKQRNNEAAKDIKEAKAEAKKDVKEAKKDIKEAKNEVKEAVKETVNSIKSPVVKQAPSPIVKQATPTAAVTSTPTKKFVDATSPASPAYQAEVARSM